MARPDPFIYKLRAQLQREAAAMLRQYNRAFEANDEAAIEVEAEAIASRARQLLYCYLEFRIGMASDDWVWLDNEEDCRVDSIGLLELQITGRLLCSILHDRWTEPFAANFRHSPTAPELSGYTLWLGARSTLLDLPSVLRRIESGEIPCSPVPAREEGWAYVFRMEDYPDTEPNGPQS